MSWEVRREAAVAARGHTWAPVDLVAAAADPPEPPTIGGLVYAGKRTLLSGETESFKTWLALVLAKAELDAGYSVAWADLDAMGRGELLARLRALGVSDDAISKRFLLYEPEERLVGVALADVIAEITERKVRLFVIDAFNSMLGLHGLDPSSTPDVEAFWSQVAQPICNAGAASTLIDHVVKNPDARSRYAYGSERKASGAHLHIGFHQLQAFGIGETGRTKLSIHKDRSGFLPRPTIGILELVSAGERISYELRGDRSRTTDRFRPTGYMERVSEFLGGQNEAVSRKTVESGVGGKAEHVRTAIDVLVDDGYAKASDGPHGARMVELVSIYREDEDVAGTEDESSSSRPRPVLVPTLRSTPQFVLVPSSSLTGDEDEDEVRPRPATSSRGELPDSPLVAVSARTGRAFHNERPTAYTLPDEAERATRFDEMHPRRAS